MERIIVLGRGGHSRSVVDVIERQNVYEIAGYIVNEETCVAENADYPIVGKDNDLQSIWKGGIGNVTVGIGFMGKSSLRRKLYQQLKRIGYVLPIICDPSAIVSSKVQIGEGTFIGKGAIINAGVKIGKMCIINSGAIIEHDCRIDDFSHVSVGTVLCGEVKVGKETFIGANATIIQGRTIGDTCVVGSGAVVRKDIFHGEICI